MMLINLWKLLLSGKKFRTLMRTKNFHGTLSHNIVRQGHKFTSYCSDKCDLKYGNKSYICHRRY